jgi:hypothetical protein
MMDFTIKRLAMDYAMRPVKFRNVRKLILASPSDADRFEREGRQS